jgi:hypothetical protein
MLLGTKETRDEGDWKSGRSLIFIWVLLIGLCLHFGVGGEYWCRFTKANEK